MGNQWLPIQSLMTCCLVVPETHHTSERPTYHPFLICKRLCEFVKPHGEYAISISGIILLFYYVWFQLICVCDQHSIAGLSVTCWTLTMR